jgi:hypothetical protein
MSQLTTHLDITGFVGFRLGFIVPFNIGISLPMMTSDIILGTRFSYLFPLLVDAYACFAKEVCVNSPPQRMRCGDSA